MNFTLMTLPIRQSPDVYIPIGAIHIAQSLRDAGHMVNMLNQDFHRYSDEVFIQQIRERTPAVIGISAVVSTAYKAIKHYSALIKKYFPYIQIILGGAASVSAEIILRYCNVDIIVIGEGENTIVELLSKFDQNKHEIPREVLSDIRGVAYLENKCFKFNGFREQISPLDIVPMPDFSFLEDHFSHFLVDPLKCEEFLCDPR